MQNSRGVAVKRFKPGIYQRPRAFAGPVAGSIIGVDADADPKPRADPEADSQADPQEKERPARSLRLDHRGASVGEPLQCAELVLKSGDGRRIRF